MNNRGWGLSEMIILSCILVGFLLLVVVLVNQLYSGVEQMEFENNEKYGYSYKDIEQNLKDAAKRYYRKNNTLVMITSEELLNEEYITISKLTPIDGEPCIGYVNVVDNKNFEAYISCEDYETAGY